MRLSEVLKECIEDNKKIMAKMDRIDKVLDMLLNEPADVVGEKYDDMKMDEEVEVDDKADDEIEVDGVVFKLEQLVQLKDSKNDEWLPTTYRLKKFCRKMAWVEKESGGGKTKRKYGNFRAVDSE